MKRWVAAAVTAGLAVLASAEVAPAASEEVAPAGEQVVRDDGHIDIGPRLDDDWQVMIRDDTGATPTWREPADVVLHVPDTSNLTVPDGEEFAFLGDAGATVWILPQVQKPGVVWPGWNTEDSGVTAGVTGEVIWSVDNVRGPGHVTLFLTGDFGAPEILFDSHQELPQQTAVSLGTHTHGNWTFSAPGSYQLDVAMTATATDGATLHDTATLRAFVGAGEPASVFDEPVPTAESPTPGAPSAAPTGSELAGSGGVLDWTSDLPLGLWLAAGAGLALVVVALVLIVRRTRR